MRSLLIALLFISGSALAVPYDFAGPGYEALKNPTTNRAVCYSWSQKKCDEPAGNYILMNYSTYPATQTSVVLADTKSNIVREVCDYAFSHPTQNCMAKCPTGMTIKRSRMCFARSGDNDGFIGVNFSSTDNRFWCGVGAHQEPFEIITEIECE